MRRFLIVNADDFGLHPDINRGIHLGHTQGLVTSASVVACGEAFEEAVTIIEDCPELDVGVHLTLVEERPLCSPSEIPSLIGQDEQFLPSYRQFAARVFMGLVSVVEVQRELEAQIKRVIASGRQPSHLDSHQHIHLLPPVWRVTKELAQQYGIRWIRVPYFQSLFSFRTRWWDPLFRLGLNVLSAMMANLSKQRQRQIHSSGLYVSGRLNHEELSRLITCLRPGISEIVTHPGISTPSLTARYHWNYEWSKELAALTSPHNISLLRSHGVTLTRFSDC